MQINNDTLASRVSNWYCESIQRFRLFDECFAFPAWTLKADESCTWTLGASVKSLTTVDHKRMFLWKVPRDLARYYEHGYRKGNLPHQDFEFDIFLFLISLKLVKWNFTTVGHPGQMYYFPLLEKILPTAVTMSMVHNAQDLIRVAIGYHAVDVPKELNSVTFQSGPKPRGTFRSSPLKLCCAQKNLFQTYNKNKSCPPNLKPGYGSDFDPRSGKPSQMPVISFL